jgi:hypothetical protein
MKNTRKYFRSTIRFIRSVKQFQTAAGAGSDVVICDFNVGDEIDVSESMHYWITDNGVYIYKSDADRVRFLNG